MTQLLIIPGQLPGLNDFAGKKTRWTYAGLKNVAQASVLAAIRRGRLKPMPHALVYCHWIEPNTRRDPDNICVGLKFILDTLVATHIIPGDGWSEILSIAHQFSVDKAHPRIEITLETKQ